MKAHVTNIVIEQVANGYVVTLPTDLENDNPAINFQKEIIDHAMQSQGDPILKALDKHAPKDVEKFPKTENVFIFQEFEQVLAFLSKEFL